MLFGLKYIDLAMVIAYFALVMAIGFWAAKRVKTEADFFLGGRSFGKGLLVMHWLCTATHSEHAVQVAGATARVGLGGIWYQWMWLFATPFYWLIAPITRRLRVTTTGDFFRIRYGRSLEVLYSVIALLFYVQSIAMLLRGAGAAISGSTGGALPTEGSVILLSILFSTYVMAGGLVAAAYTDTLQGVMIIVLSVLLVPAGLAQIGGLDGLRTLDPALLAMAAPPGAKEGDPGFIVSMSLLSLVGIVCQPHVMSATGSGKTEVEARVGMCFGNFIKRFLTVAWAVTGIIALVRFPEVFHGVQAGSPEATRASETLFGRSIQSFLGDGWRGLMIACLVAGVTSAETFMVVGSGIFTRNFYEPWARGRSDRHYLWVGRVAAAALLLCGILVGLGAESLTQILLGALQMVGLLGAAFWLGIVWRRANSTGVWISFAGALLIWTMISFKLEWSAAIPGLHQLMGMLVGFGDRLGLRALAPPLQTLLILAVEFGLMILGSLAGKPHPACQLDPFYARLFTPVGREPEVAPPTVDPEPHEAGVIGMEGVRLDYQLASRWAYTGLQKRGIELPRFTAQDGLGFAGAWLLVLLLIAGLWGLSALLRG